MARDNLHASPPRPRRNKLLVLDVDDLAATMLAMVNPDRPERVNSTRAGPGVMGQKTRPHDHDPHVRDRVQPSPSASPRRLAAKISAAPNVMPMMTTRGGDNPDISGCVRRAARAPEGAPPVSSSVRPLATTVESGEAGAVTQQLGSRNVVVGSREVRMIGGVRASDAAITRSTTTMPITASRCA